MGERKMMREGKGKGLFTTCCTTIPSTLHPVPALPSAKRESKIHKPLNTIK